MVVVVVAHNHPSGKLEPSRAGKSAMDKFIEASSFLNIIARHLIISEREYFSF
ncbi:MAG: hypothetical protein DI535_14045 [Citrobacter freundii]|nr:MAG: hypothetical protein DI535_14045 [Citrobacter freundii]